MIQKKDCKLCHITLILFIIAIIVFIIKYVLVKLEKYTNNLRKLSAAELINRFNSLTQSYRNKEDQMIESKRNFEN